MFAEGAMQNLTSIQCCWVDQANTFLVSKYVLKILCVKYALKKFSKQVHKVNWFIRWEYLDLVSTLQAGKKACVFDLMI